MIEQLNAKFGIPGAVMVEPGQGSLPKVLLDHPSGSGAEVYLYGAHVASWSNQRGEEQLFLSSESNFAEGKPIRGGVPVCWPQFGPQGGLPHHGFARIMPWSLVATKTLEQGDVEVTLSLGDDQATRALWPHRFELQMRVTLSRDSLCLALQVRNTGDQPFEFQVALHSYLAVKDIHQALVRGLQGTTLMDMQRGALRETDTLAEIRFDRETERIYLDAPDAVSVWDSPAVERLRLEKRNLPEVVVWNPWAEKCRSIPDLADEEYARMACVEAGCIANPVRIAADGLWQGEQRYQAVGG